jgi:hypothetical protein
VVIKEDYRSNDPNEVRVLKRPNTRGTKAPIIDPGF